MNSDPSPATRPHPSLPVPTLPRCLHLLGAGGAGLSGAARLLLARGHVLTGHDREASPFTRALERAGVPMALGESSADLLPRAAGGVAHSAAIPADDPQRVAARERGLVEIKYAQLLALLAPPGRTLAVAGTHGKTTSTWMLYHALVGVAGARPQGHGPSPGTLVGGTERRLRTNAVGPGPGGWFAVEACEYDRSFLHLEPAGAIVTNVEADHLDYYGSYQAVEQAFARFVDRVHPGGLLVLGHQVPGRVESAAACPVWRLGRELHADLISERRGRFELRVRGPGWATPNLRLAVPGAFNVENATLAIALAVGCAGPREGLDRTTIARRAAAAVAAFGGVERRFEPWGAVGGVEVIHDYAHHPTEVAATLEAARRVHPTGELHVLFQPHQHSRTARFLTGFVEALRGAQRVVVADVYGARKHIDSQAVGARELVTGLRRAGVQACEGGPPDEAGRRLAEGLHAGCTALVLGAGDIDGIRDDLLERLALRSPAPR